MGTLSNNEIKRLRSLKTRKGRQELGLFIVEGEKMVTEALDSEFEVLEVYRRDEIGDEAMSRISLLDTPSPVLAILRQHNWTKPHTPDGLCLGLDAVRDPGNLGTIIRISDWFGIDTIYASTDTVDVYNPKTVQSTMGAIFRKRLVYCDLPQVCRSFRDNGMRVFGTFLSGSNIYKSKLDRRGLILMGNESNGIGPQVAAEVTDRITIPSFAGNGAESLNVAVATAVTVSEFRRSL